MKIYRRIEKGYSKDFWCIKRYRTVGQSYSHILSSDLILGNLAITEQSVGELRFYDKENNLIGLAKLKVEKQQNNIKISTSRKWM